MKQKKTQKNSLKKPKAKPRKAILNYHECEEYVAKLLGVEDLRNFAGKTYGDGSTESDNLPYQDFWHLLCDHNEVHNPCSIYIPKPEYVDEEWQKKICQTFHDEFGEDAEYWVEW